MTDYTLLSRKELRRVLAVTPPEMPHFIRARLEIERRERRIGLFVALASAVIVLLNALVSRRAVGPMRHWKGTMKRRKNCPLFSVWTARGEPASQRRKI